MLKAADYRGVLAVLEAAEEARSLRAFRTGTLQALDQHLGYRVSAFLLLGSGRDGIDGVLHGRSPTRLDRQLAGWTAGRARMKASRDLLEPDRPVELSAINAALGAANANRLGELLHAQKIESLIAVALRTNGPVLALLALLSPREGAFGSNDGERLALLAPHLGNLLRRHLPARAPRVDTSRLTEREAQTAELVAAGFSNREIADRLGVSESTVKKHVSAALDKLQVSSRTQLTLAWLDDEPPRRRSRPSPRRRHVQQARA